MKNDLNSVLESSFDGISLLLVFVTVLFSLRYPEMIDILEERIEKGKPKNLEKQIQTIQKGILVKWLPVVCLTFIVAYSSAPLAIEVIKSSRIELLNFDFVRTSFILIWYVNIGFFVGSIVLLLRLFKKRIEIRRSLIKDS